MEKDKFDYVYNKYNRAVWKVVHRYFNVPDKEDAFQEVFLRIWKKYPLAGFSHPAEEMSWIMKVAVSTSINIFKAQKSKEKIYHALRKIGIKHDEIEYDDSNYILEPLSPDQRMILVLKEVEGYRYEDIAQMMNLKLGTVKSRINRAKADARKYLEKKGE